MIRKSISWLVPLIPIIYGLQSQNEFTEGTRKTIYRTKQCYYEKYLDMPKIERGHNTCGPSVGESFLRYFGLTSLSMHSQDEDIQTALLSLMYTTTGHRSRLNTVDIVNNIIKERNLTNGKMYSEAYVENRQQIPGRLATIYREIYYLISKSIESDMPVALSLDNGFHCIVTHGFQYDGSYDTVNYTYVDPREAVSKTETVKELISQTLGNIYLIIYRPPIKDDEIDFTACYEHLNLSDCTVTIKPFEHLSPRKLPGICPAGLDYHHVLIDSNKDFFGIDYIAFHPYEIKIGLTLKTALGVEKVYCEVSDIEFKKYLKTLFKTIRQITSTGLFGTIKDEDYDIMVHYIFEHYAYFHFAIRRLVKENNTNVIEVSTNRNRVFNPAKIKTVYAGY